MNALNETTVRELSARFDELDSDDTVAAVVLTGAGKLSRIFLTRPISGGS